VKGKESEKDKDNGKVRDLYGEGAGTIIRRQVRGRGVPTVRVRVRVSILGGGKAEKVKNTKTMAKRETFMAWALAQKYVDRYVAEACLRLGLGLGFQFWVG
jgi:hypothetical protein